MKSMMVVLAVVVVACKAMPQYRPSGFANPPNVLLEFGVDTQGCTVAATGVVCPWGPVQFTGVARGVDKPWVPAPQTYQPYQQYEYQQPQPVRRQQSHRSHHAGHQAFTGLVGPSGVIGPSGMVGPTGPVQFG